MIEDLSAKSPTKTSSDQMLIASQAIKTIENNPNWRQKAIMASKQGLLEVIKANSIGAFIAGAIEGWENN